MFNGYFTGFAHKEKFTNNENLKYITSIREKLWWKYDTDYNRERNHESEGVRISEQFFEASASITPDGKYLFFSRNVESDNFENLDIFLGRCKNNF